MDPLFDPGGGLRVEVDIDCLAADFARPLIVRAVQLVFLYTATVWFATAVETFLNRTGDDITQRLDLGFGPLVILAELG